MAKVAGLGKSPSTIAESLKEKSLTDTYALTGLTGGMGSGKSSVARFLCRRFPVTCMSADAVVHELLEPGREYWQKIAALDRAFVRPDQTIDKRLLREALFGDASLRQRINDMVHPLVRHKLREKIEHEVREHGRKFFLIEVPLLFEADWQEMFAQVIVVYAAREKCLTRLMARDAISAGEAENSLAAQWPLLKKALLAGHVVDNSGGWVETSLQLLHLGEILWGKK
ncbi:MAG: dephospho-CoA kinase [Desulfurivibrio sp.]|jgi:dephospho-CoA kinase|nr:MAG: dephospho-CoA kinase [Desulfurivibrio sp.]